MFRTIDNLSLELRPNNGESVTLFFPAWDLEPGYKLLKAHNLSDSEWPEIEVVEIDDFSMILKVANLSAEEFEPFEVTLDDPFVLVAGELGEMVFTLEEDAEDDDGRWDAHS